MKCLEHGCIVCDHKLYDICSFAEIIPHLMKAKYKHNNLTVCGAAYPGGWSCNRPPKHAGKHERMMISDRIKRNKVIARW